MLVYLDASIFLVWLKQEQNDSRLKGTEAIISALDSNDSPHRLVMSTIIWAEVLEEQVYAERFTAFKELVSRYNTQAVTNEIAKLTAEIRPKFAMDTPDAIHVATALLAKVDCLYSGDQHMLKLANKMEFAEFSMKKSGKQLKIANPSTQGGWGF